VAVNPSWPSGDPSITDEFSAELLPIDARQFHVYAAEWTADYVQGYRPAASNQAD
jgi:hypothetical protein